MGLSAHGFVISKESHGPRGPWVSTTPKFSLNNALATVEITSNHFERIQADHDSPARRESPRNHDRRAAQFKDRSKQTSYFAAEVRLMNPLLPDSLFFTLRAVRWNDTLGNLVRKHDL